MNRLQEKRNALHLSQPQMSVRLKEVEPRIDVGMVSRYEKGVCLPTPAQMDKLEEVLGESRYELYDYADIDLVDLDVKQAMEDEEAPEAKPKRKETRFRKCYRLPREFAESIPTDVLDVCGYPSWNAWHAAAIKRLLAEYAARKRSRAGIQQMGGE